MKIKRSTSIDGMLDAFNRRIFELGGDIESSTSVNASKAVEIYEDDDWDEYEDVDGGFGEPGAHLTMRDIKEYWNNEYDGDPCLMEYDSFEPWWRDTHQFMRRINSCGDVTAADRLFLDKEGNAFGEPDKLYREDDLRSYWDSDHDSDPVMREYDSFESWLDETLESGYLSDYVDNSDYVDAGCHGPAKSSETEIDEELEEVTGEEDLMEELDSEFIESEDEIEASFSIDDIDDDRLAEVIDKYNATSSPVSGDWDTETAAEQQDIADAFGISLEDAKQVMIQKLGFPEDDNFIGASTAVNADYNILSGYDDIEDVSWQELDSKSVRDSDGFLTDYTLYYNPVTGQYACMFGDKDIYRPGEGYYDWEGDSEEEAYEWFESYDGLLEDDFLD